jgi:hypothetical protein
MACQNYLTERFRHVLVEVAVRNLADVCQRLYQLGRLSNEVFFNTDNWLNFLRKINID